MKKNLSIVVTTMTILGLGSLTSCQDEDFGVSTAVLQEKAFEQSFIKEFGKPSSNQTWDFYAQQMEALRKKGAATRATQAIEVEVIKHDTIRHPTDTYFTETVQSIGYALEEQHDNSVVGTNSYSLTSTGDFKIYAVRYAGAIETQSTYQFEFGLAYYNENGARVLVPIFEGGFRSGYSGAGDGDGNDSFGNPGWAAEVKITEGESFHFYLKYSYPFAQGGGYSAHRQEEIFYSNEPPTFIQRNGQPLTYNDYGGASTLLYSSERIDEATNMDEQVMMIGFEDAWGHGTGNGTQSGWFDKDFNDVVFVIEGKLPIPTAKRFFCEDKNSFDWDYNDVIFDVSNNGIVLRAVGGTLPVWLRVTDRLGNTSIVGKNGVSELHQLMRSLQKESKNRNKNIEYQRQDENGVMKTYYKPIDVAGWQTHNDYPGVWLDPVQIVQWTHLGTDVGNNYTRLDEHTREVERFANPFVDNPVGGLELIVGSEHNQTVEQALALAEQPNSDDYWVGAKEYGPWPKIVKLSNTGGIPAIWSGLVANNWMREEQKITLGYPGFYGANIPEGESEPQWWLETHEEYMYFYYYDESGD